MGNFAAYTYVALLQEEENENLLLEFKFKYRLLNLRYYMVKYEIMYQSVVIKISSALIRKSIFNH